MIGLFYIIAVGIASIFACMLAAAIISDPHIVVDFLLVLWNLFGQTDSPFFWMLTAPALVILVLFLLYILWLHITTPGRSP